MASLYFAGALESSRAIKCACVAMQSLLILLGHFCESLCIHKAPPFPSSGYGIWLWRYIINITLRLARSGKVFFPLDLQCSNLMVPVSGCFGVVPSCRLPGMPSCGAWRPTGPLLLTFKAPVPKLISWRGVSTNCAIIMLQLGFVSISKTI